MYKKYIISTFAHWFSFCLTMILNEYHLSPNSPDNSCKLLHIELDWTALSIKNAQHRLILYPCPNNKAIHVPHISLKWNFVWFLSKENGALGPHQGPICLYTWKPSFDWKEGSCCLKLTCFNPIIFSSY